MNRGKKIYRVYNGSTRTIIDYNGVMSVVEEQECFKIANSVHIAAFYISKISTNKYKTAFKSKKNSKIQRSSTGILVSVSVRIRQIKQDIITFDS